MILPGCCSQSLLCSHRNSVSTGWGRVAHSLSSGLNASVVLWMLWGAAGLVCLPMCGRECQTWPKTLLQSWFRLCEGVFSSFHLSVSYLVNFTKWLLSSDYLTHVCSILVIFFEHVCVLNTELVCETWHYMIIVFTSKNTFNCNGSSLSLKTVLFNKAKTTQ